MTLCTTRLKPNNCIEQPLPSTLSEGPREISPSRSSEGGKTWPCECCCPCCCATHELLAVTWRHDQAYAFLQPPVPSHVKNHVWLAVSVRPLAVIISAKDETAMRPPEQPSNAVCL